MTALIKTEWLKIRKYNAFWWIIGLTALAYPGINFIFYQFYREATNQPSEAGELAKVLLGNPFSFPEAWHTISFASSIFVFIPAVVVIMLVTNEYSYKTLRQNIIDGWSRNQFITSKMADVLIISLAITLLYLAVTLIIGLTNPAGMENNMWSKSYYIGLFFFQTFSQLSIAFLIGFLVKRAFIALGVFVGYFLIVENILVQVFKHYDIFLAGYLPFEISDRMIPVPAFIGKFDPENYKVALTYTVPHIFLTIVLTTIIWWLCYRINSKRDL